MKRIVMMLAVVMGAATLAATNSNTIARTKSGEIKRSSTVRREFMRATGYPDGRPGYVIDHIIALKRGGCDCLTNLQWQTIEAARAKDQNE